MGIESDLSNFFFFLGRTFDFELYQLRMRINPYWVCTVHGGQSAYMQMGFWALKRKSGGEVINKTMRYSNGYSYNVDVGEVEWTECDFTTSHHSA